MSLKSESKIKTLADIAMYLKWQAYVLENALLGDFVIV
jgi:hypothetical protein